VLGADFLDRQAARKWSGISLSVQDRRDHNGNPKDRASFAHGAVRGEPEGIQEMGAPAGAPGRGGIGVARQAILDAYGPHGTKISERV
jgi:hypothetical protein